MSISRTQLKNDLGLVKVADITEVRKALGQKDWKNSQVCEGDAQEIREYYRLVRNEGDAKDSNLLLGVKLPVPPDLGVEFFDWKQFQSSPENFSHIRVVASTNGGKTTLTDWLMDVIPAERKLVCTIKRKPEQWAGLEVVGVPEDYEAIRKEMLSIRDERVKRTALMARGIDFPAWSIGFDEWKAQVRNIKAIVDRPTKKIISPSAKDLQGENLTLGRETKIRIFAMAQGRQVIIWGLEGQSDLAECFCSIYLGKFAVEECEAYRNKFPEKSEQYAKYQQVRDYLESLGKRAAWMSCELGEFPAIAPDLSGWKRKLAPPPTTENSPNIASHKPTELAGDLEGDREESPDENSEVSESKKLWELAKKRLIESWNEDLNAGEVAAPDGTFTSSSTEAQKVTGEAGEVLPDLDCSTTSLLPEVERSKALARAIALMSGLGSSEADRVSEAIALIPTEPDRALWSSLKILKFGVTKSSRDVFGCGTGGKAFGKAKQWYGLLESTFGKILE
jgi:hypothetical protein